MAVEGPSNIHVAPSSAHIASTHHAAGKNEPVRTGTDEVVDKVKTGKTAIKAGAAVDKGIEAAAKAAKQAAVTVETEAVSVVASTTTTAETAADVISLETASQRAMLNISPSVTKTGAKIAQSIITKGASLAHKVGGAATVVTAGVQLYAVAGRGGSIQDYGEVIGGTIGGIVAGALGAAGGTLVLPGGGTAAGAFVVGMAGGELGKDAGRGFADALEAGVNYTTVAAQNIKSIISGRSAAASRAEAGLPAGIHDIAPKGTPANATTGSEGGAKG